MLFFIKDAYFLVVFWLRRINQHHFNPFDNSSFKISISNLQRFENN